MDVNPTEGVTIRPSPNLDFFYKDMGCRCPASTPCTEREKFAILPPKFENVAHLTLQL